MLCCKRDGCYSTRDILWNMLQLMSNGHKKNSNSHRFFMRFILVFSLSVCMFIRMHLKRQAHETFGAKCERTAWEITRETGGAEQGRERERERKRNREIGKEGWESWAMNARIFSWYNTDPHTHTHTIHMHTIQRNTRACATENTANKRERHGDTHHVRRTQM